MPTLIHMTDSAEEIAKLLKVPVDQIKVKGAVFIQCELLPSATQDEETIAEQVASIYCRPKCGYYRDAALRGLQIFCFNPQSPYLVALKKELAQKLR